MLYEVITQEETPVILSNVAAVTLAATARIIATYLRRLWIHPDPPRITSYNVCYTKLLRQLHTGIYKITMAHCCI